MWLRPSNIQWPSLRSSSRILSLAETQLSAAFFTESSTKLAASLFFWPVHVSALLFKDFRAVLEAGLEFQELV